MAYSAKLNRRTAVGEGAMGAYGLALSVHPALADAHYNLSLLYQRTGHKLASLVHLKRYRELVGTQH